MRVPSWMYPAFLAMLLWGSWGVLQKVATSQMPPRSVYFLSACGAVAVVAVLFLTGRAPLSLTFEGSAFALLAGMASSLGGLLFLQALSRGEASVVITFTALYPAVSILLSFALLQETITLKQGIGMVLAIVSLTLLV